MGIFKHCLSILQSPQLEVWPNLSKAKTFGFTLYGGTALSLRFGHRKSVDFDFFSSEPFDENSNFLQESMPFLYNANIIQKSKNTLSYQTKSGVMISFFGGISIGRVGNSDLTEDNVACVASINDLFGTKLAALFSRIANKDYIDIAELLSNNIHLEEGISSLITLYPDLPCNYVLSTLTYFDDIKLSNLSENIKKIIIQAVHHVDINKINKKPIISYNLSNFQANNEINNYLAPTM